MVHSVPTALTLGLVLALGAGTATTAQTTPEPGTTSGSGPMSAIDWLSDSLDESSKLDLPSEPSTTDSAGVESISVTPLGAVKTDAVGLLPVSVTGLPRDLWGNSASADLAAGFKALQGGQLPALQDLLLRLLLAELDPPADSDPSDALFLARVDTLISVGAVEQAVALLERAGPTSAATFSRYFDASLLIGTEDIACKMLDDAPDLSPSLAASVFCLARNGDWQAAAVTLSTGRALGELTGAEDAILGRYLDPETFDDAPELAPPSRPSPLVFRLYEAVGEPIPTNILPLPFARADLQLASGWKSQLEAAERLARSGAIDVNHLLGLYTERKPAASGGVWDRVAAVQKLDAALDSETGAGLSEALINMWTTLEDAALRPVFARIYADKLAEHTLEGEAGHIAFEMGLLSDGYEAVAQAHETQDPREQFLKAIARGNLSVVSPPDATAAAIADGFRATQPPERLVPLGQRGNLGEAILRAIGMAADGAAGDLEKLSEAIALFRAVGLEDTARRFALQTMILVEEA